MLAGAGKEALRSPAVTTAEADGPVCGTDAPDASSVNLDEGEGRYMDTPTCIGPT